MPSTLADSSLEGDTVFVRSRAELRALSHLPRGVRQISLQLSDFALAEPERRALERRLARDLTACGCNEGAVAGLLYVVITLGLWLSGVVSVASFGRAAALGGGFILTLFLGKLFGLGLAKFRLARTIAALSTHPQTPGD
jgi:hypothetical protein